MLVEPRRGQVPVLDHGLQHVGGGLDGVAVGLGPAVVTTAAVQHEGHHQDDGRGEEVLRVEVAEGGDGAFDPELGQEAVGAAGGVHAGLGEGGRHGGGHAGGDAAVCLRVLEAGFEDVEEDWAGGEDHTLRLVELFWSYTVLALLELYTGLVVGSRQVLT